MKRLNRDTQLCISLAARPSNFGTRFHNALYEGLGCDFVYKAFAPRDRTQAVAGIRGLPIRGAAVSMPYKTDVMALLDSIDDTAADIDAVNTIVNTDGHLRGYNTDVIAVRTLLRERGVDPVSPVALLGSGGMAKAVAGALKGAGFDTVTVCARNAAAGQALAARYDYAFAAAPVAAAVVINATSVGMAGGPAAMDLPLAPALLGAAALVFDVVAMPSETPVVQAARALGIPVITGDEVMVLQAVEQHVLYTGIRPAPALVAEAARFARQA